MLRGKQKESRIHSRNGDNTGDLLLTGDDNNDSSNLRRNDHGSVSYKPSENGTTDINRNLQGLVTSSSPVILSNGIIKLGVRPSGGLFARGGTIATAKIAFWDC